MHVDISAHAASYSLRPFSSSQSHHGKLRRRPRRNLSQQRVYAVSKSDLDELEMHIAIANQKMSAAAKEDRFKDAAELRDRLEDLRLKHRLLQVKHKETMRSSIRHPLGTVIRHRRFQYLGVIFGVHSTCQAAEPWIQTMHVDRLPLGRHQPFYQVLVDETYRAGSMVTYVAQENIALLEEELEGDNPIQHTLVSQFFEGFNKESKKYIPTQKTIDQYPDSLEARRHDTDDME